MTMYTNPVEFLSSSPMRAVIRRAWALRSPGWFWAGIGFFVVFACLTWGLPIALPKKAVRNALYSRLTKVSLGMGLLCIFLSLSWGIGFGFGLGRGFGIGDGSGDEAMSVSSQERPKAKAEGELNITVTGRTVYVDAEPVPIEEVRGVIEQKDTDRLQVILIDDYSDYATYSKVVAILDDVLANGQYEKRKGT